MNHVIVCGRDYVITLFLISLLYVLRIQLVSLILLLNRTTSLFCEVSIHVMHGCTDNIVDFVLFISVQITYEVSLIFVSKLAEVLKLLSHDVFTHSQHVINTLVLIFDISRVCDLSITVFITSVTGI